MAIIVSILFCLGFPAFWTSVCQAAWPDRISQIAGPGGVMVEDSSGRLLFGHNQNKQMIPASILKIVTATAALYGLGPDYRFTTEFRLTRKNDLVIIGRGDPLLISEEIADLTHRLKNKGLSQVGDILLDSSFFAPDLILDGTARSLNPYDAFNGALNVNFNTINVLIGKDGRIGSAETQTPLTPLARRMARQSGAKGTVRLNLAASPNSCLLYAGEIFKALLIRAGVEVLGKPKILERRNPEDRLFHLHRSSFPLTRVIAKMMKYSNNFIANQIFLTLGAEKMGPPATIKKAGRAVSDILNGLGLAGVDLAEGSGLSRKNRISPFKMIKTLRLFRPYRDLLKPYGRSLVKTGTMSGVQSLAGYFPLRNGPPASFAIILNGPEAIPGKRERIMRLLRKGLAP